MDLSYDENLDIFWITYKNSKKIQSYNSDLQKLTTYETSDSYLDTYFLPSHYLKLSKNEVANCMVLEKDHIGGISFVKEKNYYLYQKIRTNYGLNINQWKTYEAKNLKKIIQVEQLEGVGFDNREIEFQLSQQLDIIKASTVMWLPKSELSDDLPDNDYESEKQNLYKLLNIFLVFYLQKTDQKIVQFMEQIIQEYSGVLLKNQTVINQEDHVAFAKILHNLIYSDNHQKKQTGNFLLDNSLQYQLENNSVQYPLEEMQESIVIPLKYSSILNPMDEDQKEAPLIEMYSGVKNPLEDDQEECQEKEMSPINPINQNNFRSNNRTSLSMIIDSVSIQQVQQLVFNPMEDDKISEQSELITQPSIEEEVPQVVEEEQIEQQSKKEIKAIRKSVFGIRKRPKAKTQQKVTDYQELLQQKDDHYQNEIQQLRLENQAQKSLISQLSQLEFERQQQIEMIQSISKDLEIKNFNLEIKLHDLSIKQYPKFKHLHQNPPHNPPYPILNYID